MCEASAYYVKENGEKNLLMKSVDIIKPQGENDWLLVSIFGDQKMVKGKIKEMTLVNHKILFEADGPKAL